MDGNLKKESNGDAIVSASTGSDTPAGVGAGVDERSDTRAIENTEPEQEKPYSSSQDFSKIGLLEARCGDVILCGRNGERDHVYPIIRAIDMFNKTSKHIYALAKNGIRGWDTLLDINKELKMVILEAIRQRRTVNRECPKEALDFEQLHTN